MITKAIRSLASVTLGLFALTAFAHEAGGPLTDFQKNYLKQYESIRAALAADDLAAAKKAASTLAATPTEKAANDAEAKRIANRTSAAKKLSGADSLSAAREEFKILSRTAVHLAEGQKGYYRYLCPHVPNDQGKWVQTNKDISNPYEGKAMPKCGKELTD
ncbi:MAG: DUF3347 domain-containing protein [Opitutaceae bacterium]|nr:DUF3347 domain-containing protein [Opitutaceae bacterium]